MYFFGYLILGVILFVFAIALFGVFFMAPIRRKLADWRYTRLKDEKPSEYDTENDY